LIRRPTLEMLRIIATLPDIDSNARPTADYITPDAIIPLISIMSIISTLSVALRWIHDGVITGAVLEDVNDITGWKVSSTELPAVEWEEKSGRKVYDVLRMMCGPWI